MATYPGCIVLQCILALFVQHALSCCGGCGFPNSGGNFAVSSCSPTCPIGVSICSENVYEGYVCVQGHLPLLGSAAVEGKFGTTGVGEVCYTCGDGDIGIDSTSCASGGSCCNKLGCNNAGCGCGNTGSCSCDLGGCCGNTGSCCKSCNCNCKNDGGCCCNVGNCGCDFGSCGCDFGSCGCDFGSCCDNCRCGSINIGSCCCDLGSCCNNCGCNNACGWCSKVGSCCDTCGCGCSNSGSFCGNCGCDNSGCCANTIALNVHPDCCFNINPMWTIDPSCICLGPGFNMDNGPSNCCQCSNACFNTNNCLDCCKCQDCCQCGNGCSNSNSFSMLKCFDLCDCYPSNMYSSPYSRRLHELLHGNDCDCGCSGYGEIGYGCYCY